MNAEIADSHSLLGAVLNDLQQPGFWWQIGALMLCLVLAKLLERAVHRRRSRLASPFEGGAERLAFPLTALFLVELARLLLRASHPVSLLSAAVPLLLSLGIIRMVFFVLRHNFRSVGWLASFERSFALLVWSAVAVYILGLMPRVIQLLEDISFPVGKQQLNLWMLGQGIVTVVVTLLIALWLGGLAETRLMKVDGLNRNLKVVFSRLSKAVLILLAILIGLPLVGIDLTTLSVFGGALGVGLGFGLQKIASNYVSGFIILLDHSIKIGNMIAVGNDRGQVTQITTRYTVLRGLTGIEAIVPNEMLMSSVVLNESYTDRKVRASFAVQISYGSDVEQALEIISNAARAQPRVLDNPPPNAYLLAFADSGINLEGDFWISDPENGTYSLRSAINLTVWREFKRVGIEIPFPQREVRLIGTQAGSDLSNS